MNPSSNADVQNAILAALEEYYLAVSVFEKNRHQTSYSKKGLAPTSEAMIFDNRVQLLCIIGFISPLINANVWARYRELLCFTFKTEILEIHFN